MQEIVHQLSFDEWLPTVRASAPMPQAPPRPPEVILWEGWFVLRRETIYGPCRYNLALAHGETEEGCRARLEARPVELLPGHVLVGKVVLPKGESANKEE